MKPLVTADTARSQIRQLLAACPELAEDEESLVLSLESETDALDIIDRMIRRIPELEDDAETAAKHAREYGYIKERLEFRARKLRETVLMMLQAAGLQKLQLPNHRLAVRHNVHVIINDMELVPEQYRKYRSHWDPMKTVIKDDIRQGVDVPGCVLSNPEPSLTIYPR